MPTAIFCSTCGASGTVAKVTAGLTCRCGSTDLGLDGVDPKPSVALRTQATPGSGWFTPMPDPLKGWSEYPGPEASPNPERVRDHTRWPCPECQGSGYDLVDKTPCKACKGSGTHVPPTAKPEVQSYDPHAVQHPGGAGWHGASIAPTRQVTVPGPERPSKRSGVQPPAATPPDAPRARSATASAPVGVPVYPMATALCPVCAITSTHLAADRSGHAWWCCGKCGSLADLDVRYDVDPFDPPKGFHRQTGMRTKASKLRKTPQDGRLLRLVAAVHAQNSVTPQEALTLARATLAKYPG